MILLGVVVPTLMCLALGVTCLTRVGVIGVFIPPWIYPGSYTLWLLILGMATVLLIGARSLNGFSRSLGVI